MRILVVGGTGHVGSYLIPRLLRAGYLLSVVARHPAPRYANAKLGWDRVEWHVADRADEEKNGTWARRMDGLDVHVVIDLICYRPEQNQLMYEAFRARVSHFLHCGTIWAYGPPDQVPYCEHFARRPITEYGVRKAEIERFLLQKFHTEGFPATVIHPGHICGRGWLPIDPQGSRNGVTVYQRLANGEEVCLPWQGNSTLHHVHADDVAQLFQLAIEQPKHSLGESFTATTAYAMTLRGCCNAVAAIFGASPKLRFVEMDQMVQNEGEASARIIEEHAIHSPCNSIAKAQRLLGYAPRYTTEQIYAECIEHLLETKQL
jgi:nucleoside-diphosphate-sugar epimerase